jgi:hypothetical protein
MPTPGEKCDRFRELVEFAGLLSREEYARLEACRGYALAEPRSGR